MWLVFFFIRYWEPFFWNDYVASVQTVWLWCLKNWKWMNELWTILVRYFFLRVHTEVKAPCWLVINIRGYLLDLSNWVWYIAWLLWLSVKVGHMMQRGKGESPLDKGTIKTFLDGKSRIIPRPREDNSLTKWSRHLHMRSLKCQEHWGSSQTSSSGDSCAPGWTSHMRNNSKIFRWPPPPVDPWHLWTS